MLSKTGLHFFLLFNFFQNFILLLNAHYNNSLFNTKLDYEEIFTFPPGVYFRM